MSILQMSLSGGVLVIAIVIIRAVALNKLPKMMFLLLWGVALFRLLVPFSIPIQLGATGVIGEALQAFSPSSAEMSTIKNATNTGFRASEIASSAPAQTFSAAAATAIWLAGMFVLFILLAVVYIRNQRELRFATFIRDNGFLEKWLAEHRLLRPITIMRSDRIKTPITVGLIKPRIILPQSFDIGDNQLLSYVLEHEYYHIKRLDALWKLVLAFALCLHWFNPMVWVMFALASRDLELTCDEMVIRRFGAETKTAYAYALIGLAEKRSKLTPLYNGFSKNAAEERIVSIMKTKKITLTGMILAVVLVSVMTIGMLATSGADVKPAGEIAATQNNEQQELTPEQSQKLNVISEEQAIKAAKEVFEYIRGDDYRSLLETGEYNATFIEYSVSANAPIWRITFEHEQVDSIAAWINALTGKSVYDLDTMTHEAG